MTRGRFVTLTLMQYVTLLSMWYVTLSEGEGSPYMLERLSENSDLLRLSSRIWQVNQVK